MVALEADKRVLDWSEAVAVGPKVARVMPEEFIGIDPSLSRLQALTYAVYTADGEPHEVTPARKTDGVSAVYLLAQDDRLPELFRVPHGLPSARAEELKQYGQISGFLRVEWVTINDGRLPIEGRFLMNWDSWPKVGCIGYVGSLTINPLLPRTYRLETQTALHREMYTIARSRGFDSHLYTILAPNVLGFVTDSGLIAEHCAGASQNTGNPDAVEIFKTWPRYWEENPQIYRFVPRYDL